MSDSEDDQNIGKGKELASPPPYKRIERPATSSSNVAHHPRGHDALDLRPGPAPTGSPEDSVPIGGIDEDSAMIAHLQALLEFEDEMELMEKGPTPDEGPSEREIAGSRSISSLPLRYEAVTEIDRAPPHELLAENVRLRSERLKNVAIYNADRIYGPLEDDLERIIRLGEREVTKEQSASHGRLLADLWEGISKKWEGMLLNVLNPHLSERSYRPELLGRFGITPDYVWEDSKIIVFVDATTAQGTAKAKRKRYKPILRAIARSSRKSVVLYILPILLEDQEKGIVHLDTLVREVPMVRISQTADVMRVGRIMSRAMEFRRSNAYHLIPEDRLDGRNYAGSLAREIPELTRKLNSRSVEPVRPTIFGNILKEDIFQTQCKAARGVIMEALKQPTDDFSREFALWAARNREPDKDWEYRVGVNIQFLGKYPGLVRHLKENVQYEIRRRMDAESFWMSGGGYGGGPGGGPSGAIGDGYYTHAAREISKHLHDTFSSSHERLDVGPQYEKPGLYFPLFNMGSRITTKVLGPLTAEEDYVVSMFSWARTHIKFNLSEWSSFNRQEFCHNFLKDIENIVNFSKRKEYTKSDVIRGNNRVGVSDREILEKHCRISVNRRTRSTDPVEWASYVVDKYLLYQSIGKESKKFRFTQSSTWEAGVAPPDFKYSLVASNTFTFIEGDIGGGKKVRVPMVIPREGSATLPFSDDELRLVIFINARKSKPAVPGLGVWADEKFRDINNWLWGEEKESDSMNLAPLYEVPTSTSANPAIAARLAGMDGEAMSILGGLNSKRMWRYTQIMARTMEKVMYRAEDAERKDSIYCFSIDPHVVCFVAPQRMIVERQQVPFWFWYFRDPKTPPPWKTSFEEVIASDGVNSIVCTKVFSLEAHRLKSMIDADVTIRTVTSTSIIETGRHDIAKDYALTTFYGALALNQTTHATMSTMRYFYTGLFSGGVNMIQLVKDKIHHLPKNYIVSWFYNHMPRLLEAREGMINSESERAGVTKVPSLISMTEISSLYDKTFFSYSSAAGNRAMHQPDVILAEEIDTQMEVAAEINRGYKEGNKPNVISGGTQTPITADTRQDHIDQARLVMAGTDKSCRWSLFQELTAFWWKQKNGKDIPHTVDIDSLLDMNLWELDRVTASIPNPYRDKKSRERCTVTESIIYCEKVLGLYKVGDCVLYSAKHPEVLFADGKDKIQDGDKRLFLIMTLFLLLVARVTEDSYRVLAERTPFELVTKPNEDRYKILREKIDNCRTVAEGHGILYDIMTIMIDLTKFGPTNNLLDYLRFHMNIKECFEESTYTIIYASILMWALKSYKVPDGVRKHRMTKNGGVYPDQFFVLSMGLGLGNIIASLITGAAYDMVCDWIKIILTDDILLKIIPHTHSDDSDISAAVRRDFRHIVAALISAMMRLVNAKEQPVKCRVDQNPHEGLSEYVDVRTGDAQTPPVKLLIPANKVKPAGWVQDNIQVKSMLREAMRRGYGLVSVRASWSIIEYDLIRRYNWMKMGLMSRLPGGGVFPVEAFGRVEMDPIALLTYGSPPMQDSIVPSCFTLLDPAQGFIIDPGDDSEVMVSQSTLISPRVIMPQSKRMEKTKMKYMDMITKEEWERTLKVKNLVPLLRVAKVSPEYARDVRLGLYRRRGANSRLNTNSVQGFKIVARAASIPSYRIVASSALVKIFIRCGKVNGWIPKFQKDLLGDPVEILDEDLVEDGYDYSITLMPKWAQDVVIMLEDEKKIKPRPLPDVSQNTYENYVINMSDAQSPIRVNQMRYEKSIDLSYLPVQNQLPKLDNSILSLLIVTYFPSMQVYVKANIAKNWLVERDNASIKSILGPAADILEISSATETEVQQAARLSQAMSMLMQTSRRHIQFFTRAPGMNTMDVVQGLYRYQYSYKSQIIYDDDLSQMPMQLPDSSQIIPKGQRFIQDVSSAMVMGLARVFYHFVYAKKVWKKVHVEGQPEYWGRRSISTPTSMSLFVKSIEMVNGGDIGTFLSTAAINKAHSYSVRRYAVTLNTFVSKREEVSTELQSLMHGESDWTISWIREQGVNSTADYDATSPFTFTMHKGDVLIGVEFPGGSSVLLLKASEMAFPSLKHATERAMAYTPFRTLLNASVSARTIPDENDILLFTHAIYVLNDNVEFGIKSEVPREGRVVALVQRGRETSTRDYFPIRSGSYYIDKNYDISSRSNPTVRIPLPYPGDYEPFFDPNMTWDIEDLQNVTEPEGIDFDSPWDNMGDFAHVSTNSLDGSLIGSFKVELNSVFYSSLVMSLGNKIKAWEWVRNIMGVELSRINRKFQNGTWTSLALNGPGSLKLTRSYPIKIQSWEGMAHSYFKYYLSLTHARESVGSLDKLLKFFLLIAAIKSSAIGSTTEGSPSSVMSIVLKYRTREAFDSIHENTWGSLAKGDKYFNV